MILENIAGTLADACAQVDPKTILHSHELQAERLRNPDLRELLFYTSDGALYHMVDGVASLSLTRRNYNLVLRDIDDAFSELLSLKNYHPFREEAEAAIAAESTVSIDLAELRLHGTDEEIGYISFSPKSPLLNTEERKLAACVHGTERMFPRVMRMLADIGVQETKIYVLRPSYVQMYTPNGPIARASWLGANGGFNAACRDIDIKDHLRGKRLP